MLKVFRVNSSAVQLLERCMQCASSSSSHSAAVQRRCYSQKKEDLKKIKRQDIVKRPKEKGAKPTAVVWVGMTIADLAKAMNKDVEFIFECLLETPYCDIFDRPSQKIHKDNIIAKIGTIAGYKLSFVEMKKSPLEIAKLALEEEEKDIRRNPPPDSKICVPRPPVVTIMGHVDHGKTTLLDYLRKSQIVLQEFGGITQHIGAFLVTLPDSQEKITFLDTPGHAAFKSMRARGARATDIVVLVVAADDGVMEQTRESLKFAREARVPIIVALNKIDKPDLNLERVKHQLLAENIQLEEFGGDVQCIPISALKGTGVKELQEAILAQADVMNIGGDPVGPIEGVVIESETQPGKGKVTTMLVQRGTVKKEKILVAGQNWCRVRAMYNEYGKTVTEATPSIPIEVTGWQEDELPSAGEEILEADSEKRAKQVIVYRRQKQLEERTEKSLESIEAAREIERDVYDKMRWDNYTKAKENLEFRSRKKRRKLKAPVAVPWGKATKADDGTPEYFVILKGDVDGSVEAILEVFDTYNSTKCKFDVLNFGVGPVTDGDIQLAETFKAVVYAFNVPVLPSANQLAIQRDIAVKEFNIIYRLVSDIKEGINARLPIVQHEEILGEGIVIKHFSIKAAEVGTGRIPIAGTRCVKGQLLRKSRIRILRSGVIIFDGEIESMKREVNDVATAVVDEEVGIKIANINANFEFKKDDVVICYQLTQHAQTIDWDPPGF